MRRLSRSLSPLDCTVTVTRRGGSLGAGWALPTAGRGAAACKALLLPKPVPAGGRCRGVAFGAAVVGACCTPWLPLPLPLPEWPLAGALVSLPPPRASLAGGGGVVGGACSARAAGALAGAGVSS